MEHSIDTHPYHHYLFFSVGNAFYQLPTQKQGKLKAGFAGLLADFGDGDKVGAKKSPKDPSPHLILATYATLGMKVDTTFMLWCRGKQPEDVQTLLRNLLRTKLGAYITITHTFFGIVRKSEYSGRTGKPEQTIQTYGAEERLKYFVLYPFTKTHEWHALPLEDRRKVMGEHIKVGIGYPAIRQCLLYSYGIDDQEFLVSYEMKTLEEFQDLVIAMRRTVGRKYTLVDTPTFTCIYKTVGELVEWM